MEYNQKLFEGNTFKDKDQLKLYLKMAKLEDGFEYKTQKSHPSHLYVKCVDQDCSWSLRACRMKSICWFKIQKMNDVHSCSKNVNMTRKMKGVGSALGKIFEDKFYDRLYTPNKLIEDVRKRFGRTISYKQAWVGCKRGVELNRGSPDESYQYLVGYSHMLEKHNPGTVTVIKTDESEVFQYYFMALGVCLEGFRTCSRPAFAVDGTHLEGERKGVLLSAIGYDANEQLYPIAFGIVDSENDDACAWFMGELYNALGGDYCKNPDLVVVSDRSDPIYKAVASKFPGVCHVFCAYHLQGI